MLINKFVEQVSQTPQAIAIKTPQQEFTYEALNRYATLITHAILNTSSTLPPNGTVGLLFNHGAPMIAALLGVLKAGMVYVPLAPDYPLQRLTYMVTDAQISCLLTDAANETIAITLAQENNIPYLNIDAIKTETLPVEITEIPTNPLAYIIYTSGSTGHPKGVLQTQENVYYYVRNWIRIFSIIPSDRLTLISSFSHDGAQQDIYAALLTGATLYPFSLKRDQNAGSIELSQFLIHEQITLWHSVPSLYHYFANTLTGNEHFPLLRFIILGGEPVLTHHVFLFQKYFPHSSLANVYGQTESSVSSIWLARPDTPVDKITIGTPLDRTTIFLINTLGKEAEPLETGEIVVASPHVSPGYWHDENASEKVFTHDPKFGTLYWTGDLGCLLLNGQIEFLGRRDSQIKIRGYRIELREIESLLLQHKAIQEAAVTARKDAAGDWFIVAYLITKPTVQITVHQWREYVGNSLPDYMIPSYFVPMERFPLTTSNKIDRKALPDPEIGNLPDYIPPTTDTQLALTRIWAEVLTLPADKIGIHTNFFELGGHSLKAVALTLKIHKQFNAKVPLEEVFKRVTIQEQALYIETANKELFLSVAPAEKRSFYPLSAAQKRLYFLQNMEETSTGYNMPRVMQLEGEVHIDRLQDTFNMLIKRHDVFRTSFFMYQETPVQRVEDHVEWAIVYQDIATESIDKSINAFIRPFDLSHAPLLRVVLLRLAEDAHLFLVDMHHIISDGTSMGLLIKEFMVLYEARPLPDLQLHYQDYAVWENQRQAEITQQQAYWLTQFADEIPVLELPLDYPRPLLQQFAGNSLHFIVDTPSTNALNTLALQQGSTLYVVLLALYNVFLAKICNQDIIAIGTPTAGRRHVDLEKVIGMFVNTLVLKNNPADSKSLTFFLAEVKSNTLSAFANQDYQYDALVETVVKTRDTSRNPLFDTMFTLQNQEIPAIENPALKLTYYPYQRQTTQFDLTLICVEGTNQLGFTFEYSTALFKEETIQRFSHYFQKAISSLLANSDETISGIEIISLAEKEQVLFIFNHTEAAYPSEKTIHHLFTQQADRTPNHIALIGETNRENQLTYSQLNKNSNQLANVLIGQGILPGSIVAIMVERSIEMVIGILSILKSGAAYLPIDPQCPEDRKQFMLTDSAATLLLTKPFIQESTPITHVTPIIPITPITPITPTNPAYIIYTSGTTGKPKGVIISHQSVVNRMQFVKDTYHLDAHDVVLQKTSFTFDVSVCELFRWILPGATLCLLPTAGENQPEIILDTIVKNKVTTIDFVPSALKVFLELLTTAQAIHTCFSLRWVFIGAEVVRPELVDMFYTLMDPLAVQLINAYGPTEATVDVTAYFCSPHASVDNVPIGKPMANTRVFILNRAQVMQPIGIPGELCIAGDCLALGYLNHPELTANSFEGMSTTLEKVYHTGDSARWMMDGNIQFLGRMDHQVKIRGFRIEIGEIENRLLTHPQIKEAVVLARTDDAGDITLVAYFVTQHSLTDTQLRAYLGHYLPDYMIPAVFVPLETIPLTPSGKVDRRALPVPETKASGVYIAPRDDIEEQLVLIWCHILNRDPLLNPIGIDDNFFHLGGHSLKATALTFRIHKALHVKIPLAEVFKNPTIRGFAQYIKHAGGEQFNPIEPVEKKEYYPVSSPQKRLYFLQRFDETSTAYNLPQMIKLAGTSEPDKIAATFTSLIERHESLRTSFFMLHKEPMQRVHDVVSFTMPKHRAPVQEFVRPFDLALAPLLRVEWVYSTDHESFLMVDIHHIIADGTSMGLLFKEFMDLYEARHLVALQLHYKDYAEWEHARHNPLGQQEAYWLAEFKDEIPLLDLPLDYPRPKIKSFAGSVLQFNLDSTHTHALNQLALQQGLTLFMVLLAIYNIFLAKICNQEMILVGTPTAGRSHADLEHIIGMFINTLVLKNKPTRSKSLLSFCSEVKTNTLVAFANQDFQYEELVEKVMQYRDVSRTPLFDTMFVLQNADIPTIENSVLKLEPLSIQQHTSKFDLTLVCIEVGQQLSCIFEYSTAIFKPETIHRFSNYFHHVVSSLLANPKGFIADIELISSEEKHRILFQFNAASLGYPEQKTIHQLFAEQSERTPDHIAIIGPKNGACQLTYHELNQKSNQLAHLLIEKGICPDTIVAIMANRSIEMIIGILGILISGAAYLPIDPNYPEDRKQFMLTDSAATILLTTQFIQEAIPITPITPIPLITPTNLAYIIYTSGSTGKPKGVMVEHCSIFNTIYYRMQEYKMRPHHRALQLFSFVFDGFLTSFFTPVVSGASVVLLSEDEVKDMACIAEIILTKDITHFICVPSLYRWLLETATANELSCLKVVTLAGEQVQPDLVEKSKQLFPLLELVNEYGPTESSVLTSIHRNIQPDTVISIGKPIVNTKIFIMDKDNHFLPIGIPGQLIISGSGLARGYLNNPQLTHHSFFSLSTSSTKFYQTGDLARWLPDGRIQFLGRMDQQVKIRGFRIEPGEIENLLLKHNQIRDVVVVVTGEEISDKSLVAYFVADTEFSGTELSDYLLLSLPDYMIPLYFVPVEKIPRTLSGKIDQRALPGPEAHITDCYIAPRNEIEKNLLDIWYDILSKNPMENPIGMNDNFFLLGGHSLKATYLASRIHKAFAVKIPLAEIFNKPTISGIAQYIASAAGEKYTGIKPVEQKEYYPLSSAQKRLFFLQQMDKNATVYNISSAWNLEGVIDKPNFEKCLAQLIHRHQSFRTGFEIINDEPVQRIFDPVVFEIQYYQSAHAPFIRPFDLSQAPLLRIGLEKIAEEKHILWVDMHHIISDGESMGILVQEFASFFAGTQLPPLSLQYKDYAAWQSAQKTSQTLWEQETFWLEEFAEEFPLLDLPTDFVRPTVQSFAGDDLPFEIDLKIVDSLKAMASQVEATPYIVLLACYTIFLAKISNQEDIVVGTPTAGRRHADLENIIGMFVNTLAIRNYPVAEKRFIDFLQEVRERTLNAFDNQDYQYEDLVEKVTTTRDLSRNPLFDTMFVLQNMNIQNIETPGLKFIPWSQENKTAKFDLTLTAIEVGETMAFNFQYSTQLFTRETIQRLITYFISTLSAIVNNRETTLSNIQIISSEEKQRILYDFNNTVVKYPANKTIHQLFTEQCERTPAHIAIIGSKNIECQLTYTELNKKSDQLAHILIEKGVLPDTIVAIMVERSIEMIIGILGILKSGGAYLPIAPDYPEDRKQFMLSDSAASILLTQQFIQESTPLTPITPVTHVTPITPVTHITPTNLAYIIYTSGSTGRPKGVMVTHQNVVRLVKNTNYIEFVPGDCLLQTGALEFDASTFEIWGVLLNGLKLLIVDKETLLTTEKLKVSIQKNDVCTMWMTAPLFNQILQADSSVFVGLKNLLVGGDVLSPSHISRLRSQYSHLNVINGYGPTENTTFSTTFLIQREYNLNIPIGKPISNSTVYILDKTNHLSPIGLPGELVVGGDGLARGYLNNPQLTHDKFLSLSIPSYIIYKTGDLARWLPDGNIEFLGRIDQQVKIRGFRIELGEIENQLAKHPQIKNSVVIAHTDESGDKNLAAYFVADTPLTHTQLRAYLLKNLPAHMIPSSFTRLDQIPLTPSGKVNPRALPKPKILNHTHTYHPPDDTIQQTLVDIWANILKIAPHKIGIEDNFFELGGHSLRATVMISKVHQSFNVEMPLEHFFKNPRISHMSVYLQNAQKSSFADINPVELMEYYPQSSAQKRLFFLEHFENIGATYNMPMTIILQEKIDKKKLESTINALIVRHETLRTSFFLLGNQAVQKVYPTLNFKLEEVPADAKPVAEIVNEFIRPFDFTHPPLLRVGIAELPEQKMVLLFDMHHIVSDGTSMGVLLNDFTALFKDQELPPLKVQYKDFSIWQNNLFHTHKIFTQKQYWLDIYADIAGIPKLDMPTDYPRPAVFNFQGDNYFFTLRGEDIVRLKQFSLRHNATTFMVLLAVYNALLFKYTGQEDIIIGCDIAGRPHIDLQPIIGMFVNELPLRNHPEGHKCFNEFLNEVKKTSIKAFENQDYQFEELVDSLNTQRDPSRNPIFDAHFTCRNEEATPPVNESMAMVPYKFENPTAKFDLSIDAFERAYGLDFRFEYYTKIFNKNTIQSLSRHFLKILKEVLEKPHLSLYQIDMMEKEEKQHILFDFNKTNKEVVRDKCYTQLFEHQVDKTPHRIAIRHKNESLSYQELDNQANRLANYLRYEKNIRPNHLVGIWMNRSIYFLISILGIMKAGAAYIPIETTLPDERVKKIINNAEIGLVITEEKLSHRANRLQWECPTFHSFLIIDGDNSYVLDKDEDILLKSAAELWNYVGETASDDITGGGWLTSYTGEPFTSEEMAEYTDNTLKKLTPLLHKAMRVLEIGCASGLTMYSLAPKVGFYYGTDLSPAIIEKNKQRLLAGHYDNITLAALPAHQIDQITQKEFDLVIINSVIHTFQGHNYLRYVLQKVVPLMAEKAYLFLGDLMDQDLKQDLIQEMKNFKQANPEKNYKTKVNWSQELFVSRSFLEDIMADNPVIKHVQFSNKIHTIPNELTKFRYDALLTVDKSSSTPSQGNKKHKYQDGRSFLKQFAINRTPMPATPDDLAYVIYTSGSTGQPKGVLIHQLGMINHLYAKISQLSITQDDIIAQSASAGFDISVWQYLVTLIVGGSTFVIDKEVVLEPLEFLHVLRQGKVTIMQSVPSLITVFLDVVASEIHKACPRLRWLVSIGEHITPMLARKWYEQFPHVKILNGYGPTEASDNITHHVIHEIPPETQLTIPIGKPLQNYHIYILDPNLSLCPVGVRGEICTAGIGVGKGYWKDAEKTAYSFIPNPFIHEINDPDYKTVYRTGDIGYFTADGIVECFGRIDNQVKIRGNRIELDEIENRLLTHPQIKEVVVIARKKEGAEKALYAYIVSHESQNPDNQLNVDLLRDYLAANLPDYMIPSFFIKIEKIPVTPNGKMDRKALVRIGESLYADIEYIPPSTPMELILEQIWKDALKVERVSIYDDFFELGGNSLTAIVVISALKKAILNASLIDIITNPKFKEQALILQTKNMPSESHEDVANNEETQLLAKLVCIEKLNKGHNDRNIFILHPLHGMVNQYVPLAILLEKKFNVYGIQAKGVNPRIPVSLAPGEMITDYLEEILTVQKMGPYIIAGHCIGAFIGYEVVRRLEVLGHTVEKLIFLDHYPFMKDRPLRRIRLMEHFPSFQRSALSNYDKHFKKIPIPANITVGLDIDDPRVTSAEKESRKQNVESQLKRLGNNVMSPGIIHAPMLMTQAINGLYQTLTAEDFKCMTKSKTDVIKTPGDHDSIFASPDVEELAKLIINHV